MTVRRPGKPATAYLVGRIAAAMAPVILPTNCEPAYRSIGTRTVLPHSVHEPS